MTAVLAFSAPTRDFPAEGRLGVIRDVAARLFYFTSIAIVFAFVLALTTGTHP